MKNCKRLFSMLLVFALMCTTTAIVSAERDFYDMPADHWAYSYVQTLVDRGTINGYEDGSFMPDALVTRAEFVKMIGKTNVSYTLPFADVTSDHWAYDYIMYCDMEVDGNNFYPDVPITRNDVLKLLWKRAGSSSGYIAPSIITNQTDKPEAAAWAYVYGIMTGDDGINLRLDDGLTRAEAAALIYRSGELNDMSPKYSFSELVNDDLLKRVYDSFDLFKGEYTPERTFTNGEIAEATMRIATDQSLVTYSNIPTNISVKRENSFSFYNVCSNAIGTDKMTEEFYDAKANNLDTVAAMMFAFNYKVNKRVVSNNTNVFYADVDTISDSNENKYITAAFENGIRLDNNNNISPKSDITARNLALVLLQMDSIAGLNTYYTVTKSSSVGNDASLNTKIFNYPNSHTKYKLVTKDVPVSVYDRDFVDIGGVIAENNAKNTFRIARDYNGSFTMFLQRIAGISNSLGAEVKFTYYPSMVISTENGYVMRVKVEVINVDDGKQFDDVFPGSLNENPKLYKGMKFYADIASGSTLDGLNLPADNAEVTQIINLDK